jgi:hypothetical protein
MLTFVWYLISTVGLAYASLFIWFIVELSSAVYVLWQQKTRRGSAVFHTSCIRFILGSHLCTHELSFMAWHSSVPQLISVLRLQADIYISVPSVLSDSPLYRNTLIWVWTRFWITPVSNSSLFYNARCINQRHKLSKNAYSMRIWNVFHVSRKYLWVRFRKVEIKLVFVGNIIQLLRK